MTPSHIDQPPQDQLQDKASLRRFWKKEHLKYLNQLPDWSAAICQHVSQTEVFRRAPKIALFRGRSWEVNLLPLWEICPSKCFFPRVDLNKPTGLEFYSVDKIEDLQLSEGGLSEPEAVSERLAPTFGDTDLILVPGLAFDAFGGRIGHGKGFYDKFLSGNSPKALKWGVTFSPQFRTQAMAQNPWDVKMDALVTENGIIYF